MPYQTGDSLVSKRNGFYYAVKQSNSDGSAILVAQDGSGEPTKVSPQTLRRWYRKAEMTPQDVRQQRKSVLPPLPKGQSGIGAELHKYFNRLVKGHIPDADEFFEKYSTASGVTTYRLNGCNIFETTCSKHRLSVLVNPKALTPALLAAAYCTYPKERNWSLGTRFVFTTKDDFPLMKQVALSGIYFKSKQEV